jgi:hypothetical protein
MIGVYKFIFLSVQQAAGDAEDVCETSERPPRQQAVGRYLSPQQDREVFNESLWRQPLKRSVDFCHEVVVIDGAKPVLSVRGIPQCLRFVFLQEMDIIDAE